MPLPSAIFVGDKLASDRRQLELPEEIIDAGQASLRSGVIDQVTRSSAPRHNSGLHMACCSAFFCVSLRVGRLPLKLAAFNRRPVGTWKH